MWEKWSYILRYDSFGVGFDLQRGDILVVQFAGIQCTSLRNEEVRIESQLFEWVGNSVQSIDAFYGTLRDIEKAVETTFLYEANITNFHITLISYRFRVLKGMTVAKREQLFCIDIPCRFHCNEQESEEGHERTESVGSGDYKRILIVQLQTQCRETCEALPFVLSSPSSITTPVINLVGITVFNYQNGLPE
ncbi:hypothetical protein AcW2_005422 [Taiwanofungus camphoratus]|nr:hypothetical protein AcW2_005422 [Antrodia cinnamomea]